MQRSWAGWMCVVVVVASATAARVEAQPAAESERGAAVCPHVTVLGVPPLGVEVPVNIPWFVAVNPDTAEPRVAPMLTLTQIDTDTQDETAIAIDLDPIDSTRFRVTIPEGLEVGVTYLFRAPNTCSDSGEGLFSRFEVGPALPLPDTLGRTVVSELRAYRRLGTSELTYHVEVELEADPSFEPWKQFYRTDITDDGAPVAVLRVDWDSENVSVDCDSQSALSTSLAPGPHRFAHEAQFPADAMTIETDPVNVEIDCATAVRVDANGRPLTPTDIEREELALRLMMEDMASRDAAGDGAGAGCSVTPVSSPSQVGAWLAAMAVLIASAIRRSRPSARRR